MEPSSLHQVTVCVHFTYVATKMELFLEREVYLFVNSFRKINYIKQKWEKEMEKHRII